MGQQTIASRQDGATIVTTWLNIFKSVLSTDLLPRDTNGITTAMAGALGTSVYPWLSGFLGAAGSSISIADSSGTLLINVGTSGGVLSISPTQLKYSINGVTKFSVDANGMNRTTLTAMNYAISSSCGTFTTGTGTLDPITNLSVTLTTSGGPVILRLIDDGSGSGGYVYSSTHVVATFTNDTTFSQLSFLNGTTQLTTLGFGRRTWESTGTDVQKYIPASGFKHTDLSVIGAAGTYTYSVALKLITGTVAGANNLKLFAQEAF